MDWYGHEDGGGEPLLGDVTVETDTDRFYLVVGVEEHRDSPRVWWLTLERIDLPDAVRRVEVEGGRYWSHVRYRRGAPRPE
jgi:hypothetical protein